ncbi:hypothetical protein F5884DRAFT_772952 [Xylogone sp. PMI_703]|nr:hypothetical protein F5884DRAFT_772952 [Xylogone sp. PMI_703]
MPRNILLLGGHGKVALLMTPKLLARGWNVTSVVRNPDHRDDILAAGKNGPGVVDVLVESIEDVKSVVDAKRILEKVKPEWVIWNAGAGGKGGPQRTLAIDRDAAIHFTRAIVATPSISKFLIVSAINSRRNRAPWWSDEGWKRVQHQNENVLATYYKAKLAADEVLTVLGEERIAKEGKDHFSYISLQPGHLTDEKETGKVALGKIDPIGAVTRGDVAEVAVRLLENDKANGWYQLLNGDEDVKEAVDRVVREGINAADGEDLDTMKANIV